MSRCDCLECNYRRRNLDAGTTVDDMRLVLAMVALSRVMYWVSLALAWSPVSTGRIAAQLDVADDLESGYFRLVYA